MSIQYPNESLAGNTHSHPSPHHQFPKYFAIVALLFPLIGVACAPGADSPVEAGSVVVDIGPTCELGCVETDPNPAQPGIFLGSGVTLETCYGDSQSDSDTDLLSDFCEKNLAAAFAPELAYSSTDQLTREPHWVAGSLFQSGQFGGVRIVYLLSYHIDRGTDHPVCGNQLIDQWCRGHYGDSEAIVLDVYYSEDWSHWILNAAHYSAHDDYNVYFRTTKAYPTGLVYPGRKGGYPRSYVAYNKHANYGSEAACIQAEPSVSTIV